MAVCVVLTLQTKLQAEVQDDIQSGTFHFLIDISEYQCGHCAMNVNTRI